MALSYKYVLPGGGFAENSIVKEMFDDVKAYVDTFVPSGGAAPVDAKYVTISTNATLSDERVLTGTANQIVITDNGAGSTVVLSLPQDIANTSTPSFAGIKLRNGSGNTVTINPKSSFSNYTLTMPADDGTSGQFLQTDGSGVLTWASVTTGVTDIHGTIQQITVSATTGSVTLSLPQDIATTSAVQFNQMMLSGGTSAADLTLKLHDSNNGIYVDGATVFEVIVNSTIAAQWDFTTFQFWNTGPIQSGSFKFRDAAGSHPTVTIVPPTGFTSYSLTLPVDDGTANQVLTTDGSGILSWSTPSGLGANTALSNLASVAINTSLLPGTSNSIDGGSSSKPFRSLYVGTSIILYDTDVRTTKITLTTPTSITDHTLILPGTQGAANSVLTNNGSGTLSWSSVSTIGGATKALDNLASVAINTALLPGTDDSINLGSASKRWVNLFAKDIDAGASGTAGTVDVYPSTSSKGKIQISATANSGDTTLTITNAAQAGARTYTIPDGGADASFVLSEGTATINGTKTFAGQLIGKGTATNDSAAAGYIGEVIESKVTTYTNSPGSNTEFNVTSIALTAGDWVISAIFDVSGNGATFTSTSFFTGISPTSGTGFTGEVLGDNCAQVQFAVVLTTLNHFTLTVPSYHLSLSGSATYYLKGLIAAYSAGTPQYVGRITARRIR